MADKEKLGRLFEALVKQSQMDRAELQKLWTDCIAQAKNEGKSETHPHFYPYVISLLKVQAGLTVKKCEQLLQEYQPVLPNHMQESMTKCAERYLAYDARP